LLFAAVVSIGATTWSDFVIKTVEQRVGHTVRQHHFSKELFMKRFTLAILILAFAITVACGPVFAQDAAAGKMVYAKKCQSCHAADGNGNAAIAKALKADIKPLSSAEIQKMSDADIKKVITMGMGAMKPVTGLMPAEVDNVVAYVRTLKK
jgi:mono/diheme cytochrome c family protein